MTILVEAYSCEPGEGSEKGVGWNTICNLACRYNHELVVITRARNRKKIEREGGDWTKSVTWIFVDPPGRYLWIKKKGSLGLRFYNLMWQREMKTAARQHLESNRVDVLHRLTFGSIVPPSLLAGFDLPLVVGPAGGAEMSPPELAGDLPFRLWVKDRIRAVLFKVALWLPTTQRAYRKCKVALGATEASVAAFKSLGVDEVRLVSQSGCGGDEVEAFADAHTLLSVPPEGPIRLLTACRLVHWKGIDLAIEAVRVAIENGVEVELTILESGPERKSLEERVERHGLGDRIRFVGRLPELDDVYHLMRECDALIHPALNEAFGQAVLESLALGRQVVCLDWAGPGMIVNGKCGIKVPPGSRDEVVSRLAEAIISLKERRRDWDEIQKQAVARSKAFSWERLAGEVDQAYRDCLEDGCRND